MVSRRFSCLSVSCCLLSAISITLSYATAIPFTSHPPKHISHNLEQTQIEVDIIVDIQDGPSISLRHYEDLVALKKYCIGSNKALELRIINSESEVMTLLLKKAPTILTKGFVTKFYDPTTNNPKYRKAGEDDSLMSTCYYTGTVLENSTTSYASVNLYHGVAGIIEFASAEFSLQTEISETETLVHSLTNLESEHSSLEPTKCGTSTKHDSDPYSKHAQRLSRFKRLVRVPAGSNMKTRYIEVYAVADYSIYQKTGSVDAAVLRVINIINYASGLYSQLNVYLALVGVEVWNTGNKIEYTKIGDYLDSGKLLSEFNNYRHYKINFETLNDNGQLITSEKFDGGLIGKGSTRAICTQTESGGVTFDPMSGRDGLSFVRAATTMAHELGHNLGLEHVDSSMYYGKDCECPVDDDPNYRECIMHSTASPYRQPRKWSECSKESLEKFFEEHNLDECLTNVPEKLQMVGNTPVCGNFFVEEGEECDCGHPAECTSKCCDPTTCKLHKNATCATGSCCNLDTCSYRPKSYKCRTLQDKECDLEEMCSGESEWCPIDTYKHDGLPCNNHGEAFCYNGKCNSHNSQCKVVWGDDQETKKSDDICYEKRNDARQYYGNCGWQTDTELPRNGEKTGVKKIFLPCKKELDKFCGLLQCTRADPTDLNTNIKNHALVKFSYPYRTGREDKQCLIASFDVGYANYDPGQVPNGAKCADNMMCLNSECVAAPSIPEDTCGCNGRGVCNQRKECHCDIGWAPPFCDKPGMGGSITSNPPVVEGPNIQIIVGLVAFFGGVVPIVVIVAVVCYCRRQEVKRLIDKARGRYEQASSKVPSAKSAPRRSVGDNSKHRGTDVYSIEEKLHNSRKAVISQPYLQSTTNQGSNIGASSHIQPVRQAPQAPGVTHQIKPTPSAAPQLPQKPQTTEAIYENTKPRTPPKPAQKPLTPPKTNTPPKPAVPTKPNVAVKNRQWPPPSNINS